MTTSGITVPIEAKDRISGTLRHIRSMLHGAAEDVVHFRRVSDRTYDDFILGSRRAIDSSEELGRRVSDVADDVRGLGRSRVDDLFGQARRGADHFRSSLHRADAEMRGIKNSHIRVRARDEVSPVLEGISSKITAIATAAGAIVIGGSVTNAVFGGVGDYHQEAARSAALLSPKDRQQGLNRADELYTKGLFSSRAEAAKQLADAASLVKDKSQVPAYVETAAKIQLTRPDANQEEIMRAVVQGTNAFKVLPERIGDNLTYVKNKVGDLQKDELDSFWEYSGYAAKAGISPEQYSHFLVRSREEGAFNFDKPSDFLKEALGVKALDSGDMAKYFEQRGAGKEEAARQAETFTQDINSGNPSKMKGAYTALFADLASQKPAELKASLVSLGSAAAEDSGDSILKSWPALYQKPPTDIAGTMERTVQKQRAANPMQDMMETQRQVELQMQEIGSNLSTSALPVMKEFNSLLVENKDAIQSLGSGISGFVSGVTSFYKDHFRLINWGIGIIVGGFAVKKLFDFGKGLLRFKDDLKAFKEWIWTKGKSMFPRTKDKSIPNPVHPVPMGEWTVGKSFSRTGEKTNSIPKMNPVEMVMIKANQVHIRDSGVRQWGPEESGGNHRNRKKKSRRKGLRGFQSREIGGEIHQSSKGRTTKKEIRNKRQLLPHSSPKPKALPSGIPDAKPKALPGEWSPTKPMSHHTNLNLPRPKLPEAPLHQGVISRTGAAKGLLRGTGLVGTVLSVGTNAYDLYQSAKEEGWRESISKRGGAMAGGVAGGALFGAVGSLVGPLGTMAGSALGHYLGEKLGGLADSVGLTRNVVDTAVAVKDSVVSWTSDAADAVKSTFGEVTDWLGMTSKEKPLEPSLPPKSLEPPPKAEITFGYLSPEAKQRITEVSQELGSTLATKGFNEAVTGMLDQPEVKKTMDSFTPFLSSFRNLVNGKQAKEEMDKVGAAVSQTSKQTKQLGAMAKGSTDEIAKGAKEATYSLSGMSVATKKTADETKQHLSSIHTLMMQGHTWGSNFMTMMATGMTRKLPLLQETVSGAAHTMKDFLGFHSPTKKGPASKSDRWAGNFVSMFAEGLEAHPIRERMNLIAGALHPSMGKPMEPDMLRRTLQDDTSISVAKNLNQGTKMTTPSQVTIQNINIDFGELAKGITNFTEFAKMCNSAEGRALLRKVVGEALYKAVESGGL